MSILKDLLGALKKSARNFPGTLLGSISAAVFAVLASAGSDIWDKRIDEAREAFGYDSHQVQALREASEAFVQTCGRWCLGSVFAAVFAFLAGLLCICAARSCTGRGGLAPFQRELCRQRCLLASLVLQALSIPLCVLVFFLFKDFGSSANWIRYMGCVFAMIASAIFLLHFIQKDTQVAPNLIVALVIAGIASSCLLAGLMLVVLAFQQLIYRFDSSTPYLAVLCFTYIVFGVNVLVAYVAREEREIRIPRPFTVILSYVLFPVTLVLLAVLYLYLLKCLVTRSMPVGQINPFVSIATALFFIFYVCLEDKVRFFKKWGNLLFLPLIPLQFIAFAIRVNAYGFTESRVASLYYIIVSVVFCLLPLVRRGRYMKYSYLLVALFLLVATWGPLNVISVTVRSQGSRIVSVFHRHGLYEGGMIRPAGADDLTLEEKAAVVSAYDKLFYMEGFGDVAGAEDGTPAAARKRLPGWWSLRREKEGHDEHFLRLFGFEWSRNYEQEEDVDVRYSFRFNIKPGTASVLDISGYRELYGFSSGDWYMKRDREGGGSTEDFRYPEILLPDGTVLDIRGELEARLQEESLDGADKDEEDEGGSVPLLLCSKQGYDIYVTACSISKTLGWTGELKYYSYDASGFVCR